MLNKNNTFINQLFGENRLLSILRDQVLRSPHYNEQLYTLLEQYTLAYIEAESDKQKMPDEIYFKFIHSYSKDMKAFLRTGKYPMEIDKNIEVLNRYDYDIVLLFSCLFSAHRFRIMQLILEESSMVNSGLFIGCGPGIEIELVKYNFQKLYAYDISINDFLLTKHPNVHFKEDYFTGENSDILYDIIFYSEFIN